MSTTQWLLLSGLVALCVYAAFVGALLITGRREAARAWAGFVPDSAVLMRRLLSDPRVARRHRLLVAATVGYLVLPIDLVPDFIPVAGQLDDAILVAVVLRVILRASGPALVEQHWPGPASSLAAVLRLAGRTR